MISKGQEAALPVQSLAFPGEKDFLSKLETKKAAKIDVRIVALRNDLCHGNVTKFINRELGEDNVFFTPECLWSVTANLLEVSKEWVGELGKFRSTHLVG